MQIGFRSLSIDDIKLKSNVSTIDFKAKVDKVLDDKRLTKEEFSSLAKDVKGGEKSLYKILSKLNPEVDFKNLMSKTGYVQLSSNTQKDKLVGLLDKMSGANIKIEHVTFDNAQKNPMVIPKQVETEVKKEVKIEHNPMGKLEIPEDAKAIKVKNPGIRASITKEMNFPDILIPSKDDKDKKIPLSFKKGEVISAKQSDTDPTKYIIQKLQKKGDSLETVGEPVEVDAKLIKAGDQNFKATNKTLFKDIPSTKDIEQGAIGDCFLIASINAMLNKGGPEEIYKMIKDNNDGTVTVKMFDIKEEKDKDTDKMVKTFTPKYITFDKSTLNTSMSVDKLISPSKIGSMITGEHAGGALWVQMLEKAYAIEKGSYSTLNSGGHMNNPFESFLGKEAVLDDSVDLPKLSAKKVDQLFTSFVPKHIPNDENLEKLKISLKNSGFTEDEANKVSEFIKNKGSFKEENEDPIAKNAVKLLGYEVGDKFTEKDITSKSFSIFQAIRKNLLNPEFMVMKTFQTTPLAKELSSEATDIRDGKKKVKGKSQDYHRQISYEEVIKPFDSKEFKNLKISSKTKESILKEIKDNFPSENNVGNYIKSQNDIFSKIEDKLKNKEYIGAGTSSYIGKPDSKGFSGGESVVDGLVGGHAFTVKDTVTMHGNKFIKVENPWGGTGRAYDMVDNKMVAKKVSEGDSWIELSDFTKHFNEIYFTKAQD